MRSDSTRSRRRRSGEASASTSEAGVVRFVGSGECATGVWKVPVSRQRVVNASGGILPGTVVFESSPRGDEQGFVVDTFDADVACAAGMDSRELVHQTQTRTVRGGVRGLHLRTDGGVGHLVRCTHGAVVDVAVDLRPASPTYRLWMTVVLDDVDHRSVWLPAGLAHGYQALTATADVCCWSDRIERPEYEVTIRHDDTELAIPWPLPVTGLSRRDSLAPTLAAIEPMLHAWFGALIRPVDHRRYR